MARLRAAGERGREMIREEVRFDSEGTRCAGWLYRPPASRPPIVILGHGFGATRDMGLDLYARAFSESGMAALAFDYRHFGDSGGEPRQLLGVKRQLADWRAALRFVRSRRDLDGERVGLWGTSFGGGHAIVIAASDSGVRAAVAQVPHVDARASARGVRPAHAFRALTLALLDRLRTTLGLSPLYVPIVAPQGRFAVLAAPGAYEGYTALVPPGSRWRNEVTARTILEVGRYRPVEVAPRVACPLLLVAARDDNLIPLAAVEEVARRAPRAELVVVDGGHFDVYRPPLLDRVLQLEADFLARHLRRQRPS